MVGRFDRLLVNWRVAGAALVVLLALDAIDVALYIGYSLARGARADTWIYNSFFNMNREFGLGELVEYAKSLVAAAAVLTCGRRSGEPIFYALAGVNVWLMGDNAFKLHETAGAFVGQTLLAGNSFGLSHPRHAGEVVYLVAFGVAVVLVLALALHRSSAKMLPTGLLLIAAVISPGVTGVSVDAIHAMPAAESLSIAMLVILEDGGETGMLSVSCALSLGCLAYIQRWAHQSGAASESRA